MICLFLDIECVTYKINLHSVIFISDFKSVKISVNIFLYAMYLEIYAMYLEINDPTSATAGA